MKHLFPERIKNGVESDGAGCYSGIFFRLALPLLSKITGVQIMYHSTGEAQCNKSSLDGHFGVAGPAVAAVVAAGKQDCTTAKDIVIAHNKSHLKSSVVREVEINLEKEGKLDTGKAMKDIPVRSIAFSAMEYDNDGNLSGVRFFKHAGFGEGRLVTVDALDKMWEKKQGSTGATLIDWKIDADGVVSSSRHVLSEVTSSCQLESDNDEDMEQPASSDEGSEPTEEGNEPEGPGLHPSTSVAGPGQRQKRKMAALAKNQKALARKREKVESAEAALLELQKRSKGFWCKRPCRHFTFTQEMMSKHQNTPGRCPDVSTEVWDMYFCC